MDKPNVITSLIPPSTAKFVQDELECENHVKLATQIKPINGVTTLSFASTKDSCSIMDIALFRLSKKNRRAGEVIFHKLPDGLIKVSAGAAGMASIWDYDLILMGISHLTEVINRYQEGHSEKPSRIFRPHISQVLKFIRRKGGGKQKVDLVESCLRLNTTHISIQRTKKNSSGQTITAFEGEPLISSYKVIKNTLTNKPEFLEIEMAKFIYQQVANKNKNPDVLTVHSDYFLMDSSISRFIYRLARKAAGRNVATWSFKLIYERSGSVGTFKKFTENLRKIIVADSLPEYHLEEVSGRKKYPILIMQYRK